MEKGGATGISVLTEPKHFRGSLSYLSKGQRSGEASDPHEGHNLDQYSLKLLQKSVPMLFF